MDILKYVYIYIFIHVINPTFHLVIYIYTHQLSYGAPLCLMFAHLSILGQHFSDHRITVSDWISSAFRIPQHLEQLKQQKTHLTSCFDDFDGYLHYAPYFSINHEARYTWITWMTMDDLWPIKQALPWTLQVTPLCCRMILKSILEEKGNFGIIGDRCTDSVLTRFMLEKYTGIISHVMS